MIKISKPSFLYHGSNQLIKGPLQHGRGFLYILSAINFEKIGKEYEWQSFESVQPLEIKKFKSVIGGMI